MIPILLFTIVFSVSLLVPYWLPRVGLVVGAIALALGVRWSVFGRPDEWLGAEIRPAHGFVTVVAASAWIALALGVLMYRYLVRFTRPG